MSSHVLRTGKEQGHFSGALEVRSTKVQNASRHILHTGKEQGHFSGAIEERSRKGQKVSTYLSYIVEDIAAVEVRGATGTHGEPAAHLHAESEHTKRSSGALEQSFTKVQNANARRQRFHTRWC